NISIKLRLNLNFFQYFLKCDIKMQRTPIRDGSIYGGCLEVQVSTPWVPHQHAAYTPLSRDQIREHFEAHGVNIVLEVQYNEREQYSVPNNSLLTFAWVVAPADPHRVSQILNIEQRVYELLGKEKIRNWASIDGKKMMLYCGYSAGKDLQQFPVLSIVTDEGELWHKEIRRDGTTYEEPFGRLTDTLEIIIYPNESLARIGIEQARGRRAHDCPEDYEFFGQLDGKEWLPEVRPRIKEKAGTSEK
ncbi:hypothetical protein ACFL2V_22070, partial [Pseudomonadota bacterium]